VSGGLLLAWTDVTAAVIAVAATVVTLTVAAVAGRVSRRVRQGTEARTADLVRELESRMEGMARELEAALEHARQEAERGRLVGELAGLIDLEEVLRRTLDAVGAVPGADAALINVHDGDGRSPVTAAVGLDPAEIDEHGLAGSPRGRRFRSMLITYEHDQAVEGGSRPISVGVAVPINTEHETVGLLSVFSRGDPDLVSDGRVREIEELVAQAAPAIENARRFHEARQLADFDALTGLHNRRYFYETLAREIARAHRYGRRLALLVFDVDDFKPINDRIGHLAGDAVLSDVGHRVRTAGRSADVACRIGGDEFAVILPESGLDEAEQLYRRLEVELSTRPVVHAGRLHISAGLAEVRPQDDTVTLFQRADDALYRAKGAGKGRSAQ
jgi:diguanylate cyclase (GGDEF)-like protein